MGHCVCVLLDTLQSHLSKAVRKVGLGALLALSGVNSEKVMECTGEEGPAVILVRNQL